MLPEPSITNMIVGMVRAVRTSALAHTSPLAAAGIGILPAVASDPARPTGDEPNPLVLVEPAKPPRARDGAPPEPIQPGRLGASLPELQLAKNSSVHASVSADLLGKSTDMTHHFRPG
jgi:hypothetical protein